MNKIGCHVHKLSSEAYAAIQRLQPKVVIVMDPTSQWIRDIKAVAPDCYLGVRRYEHGAYFADREPIGWADEIAEMCGDALHLVDGAITYNEPLSAGHDDPAEMTAFDDWQAKFISRIQDVHGIDALAFPFGTGQFTAAPDRVKVSEAFPKSCEVCRVVAPHDYGWPNMWQDEGWHSMRWLAWLSDMENAGFGRKKVVVSECGLTQGVIEGGPDIGWQTLHDNLMIAADLYLESLNWYNQKLVNVADCVGCATFDWAGRGFGWETFEHLIPYVIDKIERISAEPENGGNGMVRVYNFDNGPGEEETTWQWLYDTFGDVQIRVIEDKEGLTLQEGDVVYKLDYLDARIGDANCIINVRDKDGNPVQNATTVFGWPDADEHGLPDDPSAWTDNGVLGDTNANGDVGPGYGPGAYYSPDKGERGPHFAWIHSLPSDYVDGLGMLGMTNHAHLNLGYRAMEVKGNGNGNGEEGGFQLVGNPAFEAGSTNSIVIELESDQDRNFHETRADVFVTDEMGETIYWESPDPTMPVTLTKYVCGTAYDPQPGETHRFFYIGIRDWLDTAKAIIGWLGPFRYETDQLGTWKARAVWAKEKPDPDPDPDPDNVAEQIIEHAEEIIKLASTGLVSNIAEVHLVTEEGSKSVFVPKVGGLIARLLGLG